MNYDFQWVCLEAHMEVHLCMYVSNACVYCPLRGPGNSDTVVAVNILNTSALLSEYHSPLEGTSGYWRNAGSRLGQRSYEMNLDHLVVPERKEVFKER